MSERSSVFLEKYPKIAKYQAMCKTLSERSDVRDISSFCYYYYGNLGLHKDSEVLTEEMKEILADITEKNPILHKGIEKNFNSIKGISLIKTEAGFEVKNWRKNTTTDLVDFIDGVKYQYNLLDEYVYEQTSRGCFENMPLDECPLKVQEHFIKLKELFNYMCIYSKIVPFMNIHNHYHTLTKDLVEDFELPEQD